MPPVCYLCWMATFHPSVPVSLRPKINAALALLARHAADEHEHFFRMITTVAWVPGVCGPGALACTAGRFERAVMLDRNPMGMSLLDLAVLLSHEARHHFIDIWGQILVRDHTCENCASPWERAHDSIYREDEALRIQLAVALAAEDMERREAEARRRQGAQSNSNDFFTDVAKVAAAGAGVYFGVQVLDKLLSDLFPSPRRRRA